MPEYARIPKDIEIVDGLDFDDVIEAIETSLRITLPDEALADVQTLGDLHDLVCREAALIHSGAKCATSMSFYRLKAAINRADGPYKLAPTTELRALSNLDYVAITRLLAGWEVPARPISSVGWLLTIMITLAINIPLSFQIGGWSIATGLLSFSFLLAFAVRFMPARLPSQETVGELAHCLAARNLRRLVEDGAALTPQTLWNALTRLFADVLDIDHRRLSRESRFI